MGKMYSGVVTWNPFIGCRFDCVYCRPSFQHLRKRIVGMQKATGRGDCQNCSNCLSFIPHEHVNMLNKFPSRSAGETVWPCAHGDISFADPAFIKKVIAITDQHPDRTYYWQSKDPVCLSAIIPLLSNNSILLTTLETNRDKKYSQISKAPVPSKRFADFRALQWGRKIITIEPIMDFDHDEFIEWILAIKPESVWIGYNSHPGPTTLPEPTLEKALLFIRALQTAGINTKLKNMDRPASSSVSKTEA